MKGSCVSPAPTSMPTLFYLEQKTCEVQKVKKLNQLTTPSGSEVLGGVISKQNLP